MPQTCGVVKRADSGAPGIAWSELSVIAILLNPSRRCRPRGAAGIIALFSSTGDRLEAADQFFDGLVDRNLLAHHPVHRLGPDVLVVQDRELPVLGEVKRRGAAGELGPDCLPMPVSLPERARLACGGHREPAAERAFDV